jgi:site-specific DNA recombinase
MIRNGVSKAKTAGEELRRGVIYARVSSAEQDREGFSIPAQLKLLREYAAGQTIQIVEEYIDVETAKQSGRTNFGEMIHYLKRHPTVRSLLVEKTDRLYRNLKDWVTVDELKAEVHFAKEGVILSGDSRSSEKFMHGIKVLMAKNYIDNLSEEVRKGMQEKAEQGIWPTVAPFGYRNVAGPDGKRIIEVNHEVAPIIARIFEWYATGQYSLKDAAIKARDEGLVFRKSRKPVPVSTVHAILRNRLYTGVFVWNGETYKGQHQPLISHDLWAQVQDVLDGRNARKVHGANKEFAFSGLIRCGHCGCALVGEIKKQRYVYYHCTGYKGKCGEPYVREEVLENQFSELLRHLRFDDEVLHWIITALKESSADKQRDEDQAIARLEAEIARLRNRCAVAYADKLDGTISEAFFRRMNAQWLEEQDRCLRDLEVHLHGDHKYMDRGIEMLHLAQNAHRLFEVQDPMRKRALLNFVLSNCVWKNQKLTADFKQPFDFLAESIDAADAVVSGEIDDLAQKQKWLPGPDSNQRPTG